MNIRRSIFSTLLILTMAVSTVHAESILTFDVSGSVQADPFDADYTTEVTLSFPGEGESLASDILLVMDVSVCTSDALPAAGNLLKQISDVQEETGAKIKTGIVMFKGNAVPFQDLTVMSTEEYSRLETLFRSFIVEGDTEQTKQNVINYLSGRTYSGPDGTAYSFMTSGTNIPAGLELAKKILAEDTEVADSRKYVILISDGSTYLFEHDQDYTKAYSRTTYPGTYYGGIYELNYRSSTGSTVPPGADGTLEEWNTWLDYIGAHNADFTQYDFLVETAGVLPADCPMMPQDLEDRIVNGWTSMYQTAFLYKELMSKYHTFYAYLPDEVSAYGRNMLKALNPEGSYDGGTLGTNVLDTVTNDILYPVGPGTQLEIRLNDTQFQIDETLASFRLNVGGSDLVKVVDQAAGIIYFGDSSDLGPSNYRFKCEYLHNPERLVITVNENVSNFAPVTFRFQETLRSPETEEGTYGQLDLCGDQICDDSGLAVDPALALYVFEQAVLIPVDSSGNANYEPVELPKPSLNYTVKYCTITYTDGVENAEIFPDQVYTAVRIGTATPAFQGTPGRSGWLFAGWSPQVEQTAAGDMIYTALWSPLPVRAVPATGVQK
jgi:hypothetical protein